MCNHGYCKGVDIGKCCLTPPTCERCNRQAIGTCRHGGSFVFVEWCCAGHNSGQGFVPLSETNHARIVREHGGDK